MQRPDESAIDQQPLVLDRKSRALLRRLDPWEVRGAYEWARRMKTLPELAQVSEEQIIALAPLASEVRESTPCSLGTALRRGSKAGASARPVSEARVRRLLASEREDIVEQLAKVVRLVGRSVNMADLIATAVFWGEHRKRRVAREYFGDTSDDQQG